MEGGPRIIALDPATGRLGTTDLHARLTTVGPHPVVVPLRVESVTMQPPDLLELETLPTEPDGVTVYRARLAAAARADRYVAERLDRPITVIITGRPANDPEARPVTATIPVQVQLPPTTIHWRRADRPAEVDLTVDVEAEAGQEFALEVWVDRYDIATDRMVSDAAVEFTHMANDGRPSPLTKEQFRPHPDDLPWVRPETATRERSRWQVAADLPPPDRPELRPPVETSIRVRAWRTGSIAARHANAVTFSDRPRQLAEAVVPVVLGPVRLAVEVVEPDMPVPADGAVHEVVLRVTRVRDGRPPAGVALAFAPRAGAHPNPGAFEPTEVTLTPEAQGRVTLRWTTPELRYKPGDTYTVPLRVEQGPPDRRTLVDTVDLHLNPELSAEIRITKRGIAWDPVDVLWDAGRTPASILGTLRFPVRNRIPADRTETEPLVFDADVELWVIEAGVQTKVGETSITDDEGEFALVLPELEHTFSRPGPERRTRRLDPVRDLTLPTFHPDDAAPAIDWYDDRVPRYAPLAMFGTDLEQRVRHHRLTFADELATRPRTDADLAVSGVKLLGTAACYVHTYQQAHEHQWSTVADDLGGLFGELVNIVISAINIGDLLGDAAASVAQRAIDTFGPGIVRAVTRMAAFLEPLCQRMQTMLLGLREFVLPSAQQAYELAIEALDAVAHHLGLLRGGDLLSRVTALVEVIANGIVAAAQALWMTVTTA
ncbi:MAG: hypothetical protein MUE34_03275, partial [Acidimicrobiales bacterium]|nr:hypothetical protein [Acidimicrobiales bacterium]